jgi:alpha-maltose-1-phosphate synthase
MDGYTNRSLPNATDSPLRVLLLTLEYTPKISGGVGTHVQELAVGLAHAGCQVTVLAYTAGAGTILREPNIDIHFVSPNATLRPDGRHRSMVQDLLSFNDDLFAYGRRLLADQEQQPHIIHYHNWYTFSAARQLSKVFHLPTIGTIHFLADPIERWFGQTPDVEIVEQEQRLYREADRFIAVCHALAALLSTTHDVAADRITVIHNGMDLRQFMPSTWKPEAVDKLRRTLATPDEKIVLFAGRLNPQKGISALISSAIRVVAEESRVRYILVGEPDSRTSPQSLLLQQHRGVQDRIKLLGKVPRKQLAMLYQIADIAVVPSVYDVCPYAAIEAMAAGVPVVATAAGGLAELIEHERTGLLVPWDDGQSGLRAVNVDELVAAQLRLVRDASFATQLGLAGQQRAIQSFTTERMVQSTREVYQQTIAMEHKKEHR